MSRPDWVVGGDRGDAAAERIYRTALDMVSTEGLEALDIDELATRLHCSRATVYRHAGGKAHIRDVVLVRLSSGIVDMVRREVEEVTGPDRLVRAITVALKHIRSNPLRRLILDESNGDGLDSLHESPVLSSLAAELTGITGNDLEAAQWIVRIVLSLAYWPPTDARTERDLLNRFVAPAFRT